MSELRWTILVAAICMSSGCSSSRVTAVVPPPPPPPPPPATLIVQGVVQDSLAAKPLTGVTVTLGSQTAVTDQLGAYQINLLAGIYPLAVNSAGFESFSRSVLVGSSLILNVPLRRLKPFIKDFASSSSSTSLAITVIDLQGGATIDLANSSVKYTASGVTNTAVLTAQTTATPLDAESVRLNFTGGQSGMTTAVWVIQDAQGNVGQFSCIVGGACTEQ